MALTCFLALGSAAASEQELRQGDLCLTVAIPSGIDDYYRGVRFDHGGIVTGAVWKGHSFLGTLKQPRDPMAHDGASGAPDEFDLSDPPGYREASIGDVFMKIGVGALIKPDDQPYRFSRSYAVASAPAWSVTQAPDSITCVQDCAAGSYACHESRTIRAQSDGDGFSIERTLVCTGSSALSIETYNHTMITIDGDEIGPGYVLTYPAPVALADPKLVAAGAQVRFVFPLPSNSSAWSLVEGLPDGLGAASLEVSNPARGVAMTLSGDRRPARIVLYAERTALCPEYFCAFVLKPGESTHWTQRFAFRTIDAITPAPAPGHLP